MQGRAGGRSGFDLAREVWTRRKWLAILVFTGAFTAVVGVVKFLPDLYRATATVLVERQQVSETFVRPSVTGELETRLHTISQEILGRARLEDLITHFDLYPGLRKRAPMEAVIEQMRRDIRLEPKGVEQTGGRSAMVAFTLSYRWRDAQTVTRVTNALASFYVEENLKIRERQAAGTTKFLRAQLAEMKKKLDEQERRVSEFKTRYIGELPQQVEANLVRLERINTQLRLNNENQIRAMELREKLLKELAEADPGAHVTIPDATAARIAKLKQELTDLRTRFTDKYPDVIRLKAEIAALERQLAAAEPDGRPEKKPTGPIDPSIRRLQGALNKVDAELKALKDEERGIRQTMAAYERRVENAPKRQQELQELSRDYETTKELYASLLKRYEDAQLAESMEQGQKAEQFRILDPAIPPKEPVAPIRVRLLLVGLMLSLGLATSALALVEQLDTSLHTVDDLRAFTKVPVLACITPIVTPADRRRRRWRVTLGTAMTLVGLGLIVGASYYVAHGNEQLVRVLASTRS